MEHPILSENEKIAMKVAGESTSRIMTLDVEVQKKLLKKEMLRRLMKKLILLQKSLKNIQLI